MKQLCKSIVVAILTYEARVLLRRTKPYVIAVTGSVGKTSTKDAIFAVVKDHKRARKSEKSFNSEIGVPLSVLGLPNAWSNPLLWVKNFIDGFFVAFFSKNYPEVLVLEAGVDRPGDMAKLATWLKPDVVVMTRLPDVPVHVEYFGTPEAVVAEKMQLLDALKPTGVFVYNHDDMQLQAAAKSVRQQAVGYGRDLPTHVTASRDRILYHDDMPVGTACEISYLGETVTLKVYGTLGIQSVYAYTAAAAVAVVLDIPLTHVVSVLQEYEPPAGRMRVLPGIKSTVVIDDTYNSSPIAAEASLLTLKELRGFKRRIAVLGDMLELGQYSSREHERIGALAAGCVDMLITIGVRSRKTAEGALEHGLSEKVILQYDDVEKAARELQNLLQIGDVVLVKASQGIRAEKVVEEIMADLTTASRVLVRQDTTWRMM
jgi:UDP-N-acetylmuramoyl-tripeptide--D-alanyl-D-alanine ligase